MNKRKCIECRYCGTKKRESVNFITGERKTERVYFCRITNEEKDIFINRACPGFKKPLAKATTGGTKWLK